MKSAYELAMEKLEQKAPSVKISDEQRQKLAEIDEKFKAKIAARECPLRSLITEAQAKGNIGEVMELEEELKREMRKFEVQCEEEKERVRKG